MTRRAAAFTTTDAARVMTPEDQRRASNVAIAMIRAQSFGDPRHDARFRPMDAKGSIYIVGFDKYVKIGFSSRPKYRIAELQTTLPVPLIIHAVFDGTKISEKEIQTRYKEFHLRGEWFQLKGRLRTFVNYRKAAQTRKAAKDEVDFE